MIIDGNCFPRLALDASDRVAKKGAHFYFCSVACLGTSPGGTTGRINLVPSGEAAYTPTVVSPRSTCWLKPCTSWTSSASVWRTNARRSGERSCLLPQFAQNRGMSGSCKIEAVSFPLVFRLRDRRSAPAPSPCEFPPSGRADPSVHRKAKSLR